MAKKKVEEAKQDQHVSLEGYVPSWLIKSLMRYSLSARMTSHGCRVEAGTMSELVIWETADFL